MVRNRSDLGHLICLIHLISLRTATNRIGHTWATCSELPSNISTMALIVFSVFFISIAEPEVFSGASATPGRIKRS